jgi:hypothetical protein
MTQSKSPKNSPVIPVPVVLHPSHWSHPSLLLRIKNLKSRIKNYPPSPKAFGIIPKQTEPYRGSKFFSDWLRGLDLT